MIQAKAKLSYTFEMLNNDCRVFLQKNVNSTTFSHRTTRFSRILLSMTSSSVSTKRWSLIYFEYGSFIPVINSTGAAMQYCTISQAFHLISGLLLRMNRWYILNASYPVNNYPLHPIATLQLQLTTFTSFPLKLKLHLFTSTYRRMWWSSTFCRERRSFLQSWVRNRRYAPATYRHTNSAIYST